MRYFWCFLAGLLLFPAISFGQVETQVQLEDGSIIWANLLEKTIQFETAYGPLTIPTDEIQTLRFQTRPIPDTDKLIKGLGNANFTERKKAQDSLLKIGKRAIPLLRLENKDNEIFKRSQDLLKEIPATTTFEDDFIVSDKVDVHGRVKQDYLTFKSEILGEVKIKLYDITEVAGVAKTARVLTIPAQDAWFDTKMVLKGDRTYAFLAEGSVDLWPMTPNQYLSGPLGINTVGRGGLFMAGGLIGRCGDKTFFIGADNKISHQSGNLYLQIVPGPWGTGNESRGSYKVSIKLEK